MNMSLTRKIFAGVGLLLLALAALAAWHLGPAFSPPDNIDVGIAIGEEVPVDQPLRNAAGEPATLAQIAGPNGSVLVLVRSADWCPFCKVQLANHAEIADELEKQGYTLASLSYDEPEKLAEFATDMELPYLMLSDTESVFIDAVGLRDPQYAEDHYAYGVPRASVLVLSPDGTVQAKLVSADYRQRPSNEYVLQMVESAAD
ncbi:MAG: peroxiredoxin family protein [Altererythrobacter sp.]|nr:peroxiredoxin family protein [Altererythrobacter sp.]MBT8431110.1 peroxiredoxin family protein [Altererythrobacter sp.]NNE49261.1 peroxiredoxin family protein [Altererythrobacter sp.]NNF93086.1 peroxiredoxin family protein [Altererythrobacter sp.]NNK45138.1 peroxiredoxin family protein [Altererythrobacter sp.]